MIFVYNQIEHLCPVVLGKFHILQRGCTKKTALRLETEDVFAQRYEVLLFYHRSSKLHCQLFNTQRRSGCISDIYAHSVFGGRADKVVFAFFTDLTALFPQRIFPKRERSSSMRQDLIFIRQKLHD